MQPFAVRRSILLPMATGRRDIDTNKLHPIPACHRRQSPIGGQSFRCLATIEPLVATVLLRLAFWAWNGLSTKTDVSHNLGHSDCTLFALSSLRAFAIPLVSRVHS